MAKIIIPPRDFLIWFTGFWEGDGWITFAKEGTSPTAVVCVAQSDYGLMKTLDRNFNVGSIQKKDKHIKSFIISKKPIYQYTISGVDNCRVLLKAMLPFMRLGRRIIKAKRFLEEWGGYDLTFKENGWRKSENQFILDNVEKMDDQEMGLKLKRSIETVRAKRLKLGIRRQEPYYWSDEEVKILRENVHLSNKKLSVLISGHTFTSISSMKHRLGIARYPRSKKDLKSRWVTGRYIKPPTRFR